MLAVNLSRSEGMNTTWSTYEVTVTEPGDGRTIVTLDNVVSFDFRSDTLKQWNLEGIKTGDSVSILGRYGPHLLQLASLDSWTDIKLIPAK